MTDIFPKKIFSLSIQKSNPKSGVNIDGKLDKSICVNLLTPLYNNFLSEKVYPIRKAQATIANNAQPSTKADVRIMFVWILPDASG